MAELAEPVLCSLVAAADVGASQGILFNVQRSQGRVSLHRNFDLAQATHAAPALRPLTLIEVLRSDSLTL